MVDNNLVDKVNKYTAFNSSDLGTMVESFVNIQVITMNEAALSYINRAHNYA